MNKTYSTQLLLYMCCLVGCLQAETVLEALEKESFSGGIWHPQQYNLVFIPAQKKAQSLPAIMEFDIPEYWSVFTARNAPIDHTPTIRCIIDDQHIKSIYKQSLSYMHQDPKEIFASLYKIHLMPKPDDIVPVASLIAHAIAEDSEFNGLVAKLKITHPDLPVGATDFKSCNISDIFFDTQGNVLPFIVLYAYPGTAQELINRLDNLLHEYKGIQLGDFPESVYEQLKAHLANQEELISTQTYILPRFSIAAKTRDGSRTSSLIYYAQGNGNHKNDMRPLTFNLNNSPFEHLWGGSHGVPRGIGYNNEMVTIPGYARFFDPVSNGALLYPDYFGEIRDFHLYLPDN